MKKQRRSKMLSNIILEEAIQLLEGSNLTIAEISNRLKVLPEILVKSMDEHYGMIGETDKTEELQERDKAKRNSNERKIIRKEIS